jgi:hypothetical protein
MASRSGKDHNDSFDKWRKEAKLPTGASLQDLLACIAAGRKRDGGVLTNGNQIEAYAELAKGSSARLVREDTGGSTFLLGRGRSKHARN